MRIVIERSRQLRDERGAVAVVVAVSLLALLGVGAVAVDSGRNWSERRRLVTAVESATLAAAHDYAHGDAGCVNTAPDYLQRNYPDAKMTVCNPNGDVSRGTFGWVTVTAEVEIDQFFAGVLGSPEKVVSATSSAMFGVPAAGGVNARPMALCYGAIAETPEFKAWQQDGGTSSPLIVPFTNSALRSCNSAPQVECSVDDGVRSLVEIFGDAYYDEDRGEYIITEDRNYQRGAVMSDRRIDITQDFDIVFDVYLGKNDAGADGMGFVFHNDPRGGSTLGNNGGGLGMSGIKNSIGIEFDTWQNTETHGTPPRVTGDDPTPALIWNPRSRVTERTDLAVGYRFYTQTEQVATHLGAYDSNGNGRLDNGDSTSVRLWDDEGGLLAEVEVPRSTAVEADGFAYVELSSPVTLPANRYYRVAAEARARAEGFSYGGRASMSYGISFVESVWAWTNVVGFPEHSYNTYGYIGGTLKVLGSTEDPNYPAAGTRASDDPPQDHTAIYDPEHLVEPANYGEPEHLVLYGAASRLSPLVLLPNIEDRHWHEASISWDADSKKLAYFFDGSVVAVLSIDLAADHLGDNFAYFGFAGSTGGAKNLQKLRFKKFDTTVEGGNPMCDDPTETGGGSGNWGMLDFDGGSNSNRDIVNWIENGYDTTVDAGKIFGSPGSVSGAHASALKTLVDSNDTFALPLYSAVEGNGANTILDVVAFVNVKLTDFKVTGPSRGRYLEFTLVSSFENRACCIEIPTDGSYIETNQRTTRVVALNNDGTPKRS